MQAVAPVSAGPAKTAPSNNMAENPKMGRRITTAPAIVRTNTRRSYDATSDVQTPST